MRNFKSWLISDGRRQYRIFYRVGYNRLSYITFDIPKSKIKVIQ